MLSDNDSTVLTRRRHEIPARIAPAFLNVAISEEYFRKPVSGRVNATCSKRTLVRAGDTRPNPFTPQVAGLSKTLVSSPSPLRENFDATSAPPTLVTRLWPVLIPKR